MICSSWTLTWSTNVRTNVGICISILFLQYKKVWPGQLWAPEIADILNKRHQTNWRLSWGFAWGFALVIFARWLPPLGTLLCKLSWFRVVVGPKNVPACVQGYANRRPGIFYTFYSPLGSTMLVWGQSGDEFGVSFGQVWVQFSSNLGSICDQFFFGPRMCPHASGVMPVRGIFTHFI